MSLVSGAEVVLSAAKAGRGVGAFNVIQLEHATALIAGAEQAGAPVILQISENAVKYHGALKPIGVATLAAAAAASVPVVVHLDHAMDRDLVTEAVFVMTVPSGVAALTFTTIVKVSGTSFDPNAVFVNVTVPVPPGAGAIVVHPPGAEAETKVVFAGVASVMTAFWAVFGPRFWTSIV